MAHFAQIDANSVVQQVIVVGNPDCLDENGNESEAVGIAFCKSLFKEDCDWVQTSYNANFRKNYAGIGFVYDKQRDAFIPPKPFSSWVLNEDTCTWEPPSLMPNDGKPYKWDEDTGEWKPVELPPGEA